MIQPDGANAEDHESNLPHEDVNGADGAGHSVAAGPGADDRDAHGQDARGQDADGQDADGEDASGSDAGGKVMKLTQGSAVTSAGRDVCIEPFLAAAAGERIEHPQAERPLYSKLLDYSAHAAMIVGLLGFAWTLSAHTGKQPDAAPAEKVAALAPVNTPPVPETDQLRANTQKMAADISALRLSLEALRSGMHGDAQRQDKTIEQIKALASNLDSVKAGLTATKTETTSALTQLAAKIDHLQHGEPSIKIQQVADRLDKLEHETADQTVTASLPPASSAKVASLATPPVKPQIAKTSVQTEFPEAAKKQAAAAEAEAAKKPQIIPEWVVREVDDGVAIVESKRGQLAVEQGGTIPGAGVVKSIERHGGTWMVTTSKGQLAYVPLREQTPRDYPRNYYRPGPGPEDY
jgi:hypothetical protein